MIQFAAGKAKAPCALCEEMLTEALDETLSEADHARFHAHLAACTRCAQMYLEAERGAGWLRLLKTGQPELQEYRTGLVSSILSRTTGTTHLPLQLAPWPTLPVLPLAPLPQGQIAPWIRPAQAQPRVPLFRSMSRILFEPRLAMTAAMAFFSVAMTLNMTGVQLNQLHARDLNPLHLRRDLYRADAHAIRYYDNLRVVHVLESRVDDLRDRIGDTPPGPDHGTPAPANENPAAPIHPRPEQKVPLSNGNNPGTSHFIAPELPSQPVVPDSRSRNLVAADLVPADLAGGLV